MIAKFEIPNIFVAIACAVFCSQYAAAQFYTVTKDSPVTVEMHKREVYSTDNKSDSATPQISSIPETVIGVKNMPQTLSASIVTTSKSHFQQAPVSSGLPDLTIPNLIAEIEKNGIKYPKIVLAQAILETGWFKSPVCRNKHNLFGLTNPRTGKYYEFNHWTESVKAYYTKVQYRYYQKNKKIKSDVDYLIWLKKIGYAEDPGYIRAVIRILLQLHTDKKLERNDDSCILYI